jgi:glycyl-tRNA synthetase
MVRLREFTQVEGQIFLLEEDESEWPPFQDIRDEKLPLLPIEVQEKGSEKVSPVRMTAALKKGYFQKPAYAWCVYLAYRIFREMGFTEESIRLRQHLATERAHYAADAWDVEILTRSFGWIECCGVHDRGNYDLTRHQEFSNEKLSVKVNKKPVVPEVLEIAFGVERPLYCIIDNSYMEDERTWLKFPPPIAPIQVSVFPLMGKPELLEPARRIYDEILESGLVTYFDQSGSIGRRYRRQDEVGTPFCVTVDYDSLEDQTVTIRDRDTMSQVRVKTDEIVTILRDLVKGEIEFSSLE